MSQSHHANLQGRANSCTSGEATSARNYKFPTSHERHFPIPHEWLSRRGEIKIPHERLRRSWGILILPQLLSHEWGIGKCLEWRVGNFPSLQISMMGLAFLYSKWKPSYWRIPLNKKSKSLYSKEKAFYNLFLMCLPTYINNSCNLSRRMWLKNFFIECSSFVFHPAISEYSKRCQWISM